jgi:hypothetical protein
VTTRREFLLSGAAISAVGFCNINGTGESAGGDYAAAFDFDEGTFSGTITEPDGTINNLSGYHGVGDLPPLGGGPCPPVTSTADVILSGVVNYPAGFTVPAGQVWEIDPATSTTITAGGNIIVNGTLRSLPPVAGVSHRIRFTGINEANIVGGMAMAPVASDIGLWVDGGTLDISGTPKVSWNRTGSDPSWLPTDELIVTPTGVGQYAATPFAGVVPQASTALRVNNATRYTYSAEVVNMTRDFTIESVNGRAHIMFTNCTTAQRLEYVELRRLGPTGKFGRYPLHVHMNGHGTDGSSFRGNVARDCGNHAFVPHASHGCDFTGSIAYRTTLDAFWWDEGDRTDRAVWNRCGAIETVDGSGFKLLTGIGNTCVESFATGTQGDSSQAGVMWPSQSNATRHTWQTEGLVCHNNRTHGVRVWQNTTTMHSVIDVAAYRNQRTGFSHGAYMNHYRYQYCVAFGNGAADFEASALGRWLVRHCWLEKIGLAHHNVVGSPALLTFETTKEWTIGSVAIYETGFPGTFRFVSDHNLSDIAASAFTVTGNQLSTIEVSNYKAADFTLTP